MSRPEPSEEELRAALEEQMRRITVPDVLLQTVATLVNLAGRKLGLAPPGEEAGDKDLEQARLAIEAVRALLPLLPAEAGPVRDALSQLQVAYAREAQAAGTAAAGGDEARPGAEPGGGGTRAGEAGGGPPSSEEAERAKARARIWTPPGT